MMKLKDIGLLIVVVDQLAETRRRLAAVEVDPAKLEARRVNDNEPEVRQTAIAI